eukprot:NODE_1104_length_1104_cov_8.383886_g845_i0.p1 GENE.NODE_1104_length_1104_cov_8.383886_g845_i0~~NODE_1104_length_1104_cov_8.383886_g845_i0.p1  ORF type:complete len:348 (-),score=116.47 NODE_1104_length_1104_cov_8.383886_g845_i0:59-1048(-)
MSTVCVTGATGFIALHLIQQLLQKGYAVHGTVRKLGAPKTAPLKAMQEQFPDKLKLFEADCLLPDSFDAALQGCEGCFHTASPFFIAKDGADLQKEFVDPAVKGTTSVLAACSKAKSVKRLVLTSSIAAMVEFPPNPFGIVYNENSWNNISTLEMGSIHAYRVSKTQAERAAWEYVKQNPDFELAVVNPSLVLGPLLGDVPTVDDMNTSSQLIFERVTGQNTATTGEQALVDVSDVAKAHILALEVPDAAGKRFVTSLETASWKKVYKILKEVYPAAPVVAEEDADTAPVSHNFDNSQTRKVLGMEFIPLEEALKRQVDSFIQKGLLPA